MATIFVNLPGAGYGPMFSTTSVAVGTGPKTFTVGSGFAFAYGAFVSITSTGSGAVMYGTVTSYTGTTFVVAVSAVGAGSSGTHSDWAINLSAVPGINPVADQYLTAVSQGQTVFTPTIAPTASSWVFLRGSKMRSGSSFDYQVVGSTIVFNQGVNLGDVVEVLQ